MGDRDAGSSLESPGLKPSKMKRHETKDDVRTSHKVPSRKGKAAINDDLSSPDATPKVLEMKK